MTSSNVVNARLYFSKRRILNSKNALANRDGDIAMRLNQYGAMDSTSTSRKKEHAYVNSPIPLYLWSFRALYIRSKYSAVKNSALINCRKPRKKCQLPSPETVSSANARAQITIM
mmetsp:Transcript_31349/g.70966  ORF Transcript_31349/g.70966 Transcript_31349/m.70966 type:complete len:115 (+) Transcript_31349:3529-3873(+)